MKEHGALFTGDMSDKIFHGLKSQTRRLIKLPPAPSKLGVWEPCMVGGPGTYLDKAMTKPAPLEAAIWHTRTGATVVAPWQVGDQLWVREAWRTRKEFDNLPPRDVPDKASIWYVVDFLKHHHTPSPLVGKYRHARFMCRFMSRTTMEVVGVRAEPLRAITFKDVEAEGTPRGDYARDDPWIKETSHADVRIHEFSVLWDSINADRAAWSSDPWVWVYTFRKLLPAGSAATLAGGTRHDHAGARGHD